MSSPPHISALPAALYETEVLLKQVAGLQQQWISAVLEMPEQDHHGRMLAHPSESLTTLVYSDMPLHSIRIFVIKTFVNCPKTIKFAKVFTTPTIWSLAKHVHTVKILSLNRKGVLIVMYVCSIVACGIQKATPYEVDTLTTVSC